MCYGGCDCQRCNPPDELEQAVSAWTTERPTQAGWYWFRYTANSKPHATKIELGSYEGDNSGILYCRENSYVPGNACYIKDGEWQAVQGPRE